MCFAKFLEENLSGSLSHPCCSNPLRLLTTVGCMVNFPTIISLFILFLQPQVHMSKSHSSIKTHHKCPHSRKLFLFFPSQSSLFPLWASTVILLPVTFANANLSYHSPIFKSTTPCPGPGFQETKSTISHHSPDLSYVSSLTSHNIYPSSYTRLPSTPQRFYGVILPSIYTFSFLYLITLCPANSLSFQTEFSHLLSQGGTPDLIWVSFLCASTIPKDSSSQVGFCPTGCYMKRSRGISFYYPNEWGVRMGSATGT